MLGWCIQEASSGGNDSRMVIFLRLCQRLTMPDKKLERGSHVQPQGLFVTHETGTPRQNLISIVRKHF